MKGVTRVTASLLAAAMTAGLGTTAVFADAGNSTGGSVGPVVTTPEENGTRTTYLELFNQAGGLVASTDAHEEEYWDYAQNKSVTVSAQPRVTLPVYLTVGGTATFNAKLDSKSTYTTAWSYADLGRKDAANSPDGKIDKYDIKSGTTPEIDVVDLDNGKLTAKNPGEATIFVYATDADKTETEVKDAQGNVVKDANGNAVKATKLTGQIIELDVVVGYPEKIDAKFTNRDSILTHEFDYDGTNDKVANATKLSDFDPVSTHDAVELNYQGSQYVSHVSVGDTNDVDYKVYLDSARQKIDMSDSNDSITLAGTDARSQKMVSFSGKTMNVIGDAPKKGFGTVQVFYHEEHTYNNAKVSGDLKSNKLAVLAHTGTDVYRLYNPNTGEHLYTVDPNENAVLPTLGWIAEGTGWYAPEKSSVGVTRMFNPNNGGEHVYTTDAKEIKALEKAGWKNEGVKFYDASSKWYPLYRQYNPNAVANNHNYTGNIAERTYLVSLGWKDEGVKLHALELAKDTIKEASKVDSDVSHADD